MGYKDDDPRYMSTMGPFHDELKKAQKFVNNLKTEIEKLNDQLDNKDKRIEKLEAQLFKASNLIHQIRKLAVGGIPTHPEGPSSMEGLGELNAFRDVLDLIDASQPPLAITDDEKAARIEEVEGALRAIVAEENAFMSDPIGNAGVTHRQISIARTALKALEDE